MWWASSRRAGVSGEENGIKRRAGLELAVEVEGGASDGAMAAFGRVR